MVTGPHPLTYPALLAGTRVGLYKVRRVHSNIETQCQGYTPGLELGRGRGGEERIGKRGGGEGERGG